MSAPAFPPPDENALDLPEAWLRERHPRRDRLGPRPEVRPDKDAAEKVRSLLDAARPEIEDVLALPGTDPGLAECARAYLRGEPDPVGAAVIAHLTYSTQGFLRFDDRDPFPDAWTAEHGLPFAACAYAELCEVTTDYTSSGGARTWRGVRDRRPRDYIGGWWHQEEAARHVRGLLAAADDGVYAEAVARLADHRGTRLRKVVVSYLVPTREDWVDDVCAAAPSLSVDESLVRWMVFCSLGQPDQPRTHRLALSHDEHSLSVFTTLVEGIGPAAAAPLLAAAADERYIDVAMTRTLLDVLARLPADEAFQALVDRIGRPHVQAAVSRAAKRFPRQALRLLARAADVPAVRETLSAHLLAHPGLVEEVLPELPEESRAAIRAVQKATERYPEAASLPPLFAAPPWTRARPKAKPVVVKGLTPPGTRRIVWEPGERDAWTVDLHHLWRWVERLEWPVQVERFKAGDLPPYMHTLLFVEGPEELVRPLLDGWEPPQTWDVDEWMRVVVARFELDALAPALAAARRDPANAGVLLMPFLGDEVASTMADWLVRLKQAGKTARAWFGRHGTAAVPALVPAALGPASGKAGAGRRAAEAALRVIAARHGAEAVVEAARVHGEPAARAIKALLATDPADVLPAKMPVIGDWADARALPQILLRDRTHALPDAAAEHVLTMLALSKPGDAYAGLDTVREVCDPGSLAEFGWAVFRRWESHGAPPKDGWALTQLGLIGDDETVRRLTPVIRAWPGEGGHAKAVNGLDVLAEIGTGVALTHLHAISQRVKYKALRKRAQEKMAEVAAGLRLTAEQLADRLVPDLGLDADGSMVLDYGPRRFTVGFDEQLRPHVADEDGTRRKALPKPGAKDDPDLAPAAYKAFSALKKDVRTVAADQVRRLETAMVTRRRWSMAEFRDLLAGHPLVGHIVRRLVWISTEDEGEDGGGKAAAFRVAEDRTFAGADDDVLTLPDSASVRVAHPVDLGASLAAWSELFADYQILQPFPQLGRGVHELTAEERASGRLARFEGATVPVGRVLGLERRGWERGVPQDAGVEPWISRRVAPDRYVVIDLDPGISVAATDMAPEQTLDRVGLLSRPDGFWRGGTTVGAADLDPVIASEILADLVHLTGTPR